MRNQEWYASSSKLDSLDLSKLVLGLSCLNTVYGKSTLGIVDKSEVLASLLNADHIHEAGWVVGICPHFPIDLDKSLHDNLGDFSAIESVLQSIPNEDNKRKAVSKFVRTRTAGIVSRVLRFVLQARRTMALAHKHQTACQAANAMALTDASDASLDLYPS